MAFLKEKKPITGSSQSVGELEGCREAWRVIQEDRELARAGKKAKRQAELTVLREERDRSRARVRQSAEMMAQSRSEDSPGPETPPVRETRFSQREAMRSFTEGAEEYRAEMLAIHRRDQETRQHELEMQPRDQDLRAEEASKLTDLVASITSSGSTNVETRLAGLEASQQDMNNKLTQLLEVLQDKSGVVQKRK